MPCNPIQVSGVQVLFFCLFYGFLTPLISVLYGHLIKEVVSNVTFNNANGFFSTKSQIVIFHQNDWLAKS